jgi:hypothetical protein
MLTEDKKIDLLLTQGFGWNPNRHFCPEWQTAPPLIPREIAKDDGLQYYRFCHTTVALLSQLIDPLIPTKITLQVYSFSVVYAQPSEH